MINWKEATLLAAMCGFFTPAEAVTTSCSEWANFSQVLVLRWQGDRKFENVTNEDVKKELAKTMGNHPEFGQAIYWVDVAYAHRNDNPVHLWQFVMQECGKEAI